MGCLTNSSFKKFEYTKRVLRSRNSKDRQLNGQMKQKEKRRTNKNNLQSTTQKTKLLETQNPTKTRGCSSKEISYTRRVFNVNHQQFGITKIYI